MQNILRKLTFGFKYNPGSEFIVIPFGKKAVPSRFLSFGNAEVFAISHGIKYPQFPEPAIMVILNPRKDR